MGKSTLLSGIPRDGGSDHYGEWILKAYAMTGWNLGMPSFKEIIGNMNKVNIPSPIRRPLRGGVAALKGRECIEEMRAELREDCLCSEKHG